MESVGKPWGGGGGGGARWKGDSDVNLKSTHAKAIGIYRIVELQGSGSGYFFNVQGLVWPHSG